MPLAIKTPDGSIELMQVKKPEGIHLTSIGWCDGSLNLIRAINTQTLDVGWHCSKKSEACKNCYAEAQNVRYGTRLDYKAAHLSSGLVMQQFDMQRLEAALRWKAPRDYVPVAGDGRLKVFMADMIDLCDESVPGWMIVHHFALALLRPEIDWLILTKVPEKLARLTNSSHFWGSVAKTAADLANRYNMPCLPGMYEVGIANPPCNVWIGTTVENQPRADERIPHLLNCPAAVRFLSVEPLLEDVNLKLDNDALIDLLDLDPQRSQWTRGRYPFPALEPDKRTKRSHVLNWVIVGGESGAKARPCNVAWIREIVRQCKDSEVPVFVKQLGAYILCDNQHIADWEDQTDGAAYTRYNPDAQVFQGDIERVYVGDAKGGNIDEFPEDLRVREWPKAHAQADA